MSARAHDDRIDPTLIADLSRACEQRDGRPISGGREIRFGCPVHQPDAHPSARWSAEKAVWHCDACDAGGGAYSLADLLDVPTGRDRPRLTPVRPRLGTPDGSPGRTSDETDHAADPRPQLATPTIAKTYSYGDDHRVVRYEPKDFRPQHRVAGVWKIGKGPGAWPLYRQDDLPGDRAVMVHVTEGEKDADTLADHGLPAVSPGSSANGKAWRDEWTDALAGRPVLIHADNDQPGHNAADAISRRLLGHAASVRIATYPDLPAGGDVSDYLATHDLADLMARIEALDPVPHVPAVPAFPLEVLPPGVREYVARASARLAVPPEMVAAPLLAMAGALIGHRLRLALKGGWEVLPTLWVAIVAPPGAGKSPAMNFARRGLEHRQQEAYEQYQQAYEGWKREHKRGKASKEDDPGEEPREPKLRHYWTSNTTTEALADRLTHAHGIAVVADELSGWIGGMNQYKGGKGGDRQNYLELWSGSRLKIDRQSRPSVLITFPVVCIVGGIQDDVIGALNDERDRRDGLIERLLYVRPQVEPAKWTDDEVPESLGKELERVFDALDHLPAMDRAPVSVHLSPDAKTAWRTWHDANAEVARSLSGLARGFASKWPEQTARLALILHALWSASDGTDHRRMLDRERLEDAIEVTEWFRAHLDLVLPLFQAAGSGQPQGLGSRVLRQLRRHADAWRRGHERSEWMSYSALYNALRNVPADALKPALATLEAQGTIERQAGKATTKPLEEWREKPRDRSYYSDFPDQGAEPARSVEEDGAHDLNSTNVSRASDETDDADVSARAAELKAEGADVIARFREELERLDPASADAIAARRALDLAEQP